MAVCGKRQFELLEKMGFVRISGTPEESKAAQILIDEIATLGLKAEHVPFEVDDGTVELAKFAVLEPEYKEYTVTGYKLAKNTAEGGEDYDFMYLEQFNDVMLAEVKDKVVLVNGRMTADNYKKLIEAGAAGFITMGGTVIDEVEKTDLDTRTLRSTLSEHGLMPAFHIRMIDALEILKSGATRVHIELHTTATKHTSHNVYVEVPGTTKPEEIVDFGAHYDSVEFSPGVWDNAAGCVTIMEILRHFVEHPPVRTCRFIFFGSEELGLNGSKAYVASIPEEELPKHVFMVNADVGGSVLGANSVSCTSDEGLCKYVEYMAREVGYSTSVRQSIMSSDSVPFADRGIPAINFARGGGPGMQGMGFMHTRYDMISLISPEALAVVTEFAVALSERMVNAKIFPVPRTIPKNIREDLDKYLAKKPEEKK